MTEHSLKVHPQFWPALISGQKPFELRRNDRNFKVGDSLNLSEYNPSFGYTKSGLTIATITYILYPDDCPGLEPGFVILGLGGLRL